MNTIKLRDIIKKYKHYFKEINQEEIYKWRAIKTFQEQWDITALDFNGMLENAFANVKNLLDSGKYFPKRMLLMNSFLNPEYIRNLFKDLYNEDKSLLGRINTFKTGFKSLNEQQFIGKNDFQDTRAIMLYLTMRFPEKYYLYKSGMFKKLIQSVDYPYDYVRGSEQNVPQYLHLCAVLKEEILLDAELISLHKTRIKAQEYLDPEYNVLTQDIIYAAVKHLDKFEQVGKQISSLERLIKFDITISPSAKLPLSFKGNITDHLENQKENTRIGRLGELLVYQYEKEKFENGLISKSPIHKAVVEGDGLGYDILSYNEKGEEIFIEVKTTKNSYNTPFYLTKNELEKSKIGLSNFALYRLYEFDDINNTAKFYERTGDLTELCINPVLYFVK